jgi:hypothetical protein
MPVLPHAASRLVLVSTYEPFLGRNQPARLIDKMLRQSTRRDDKRLILVGNTSSARKPSSHKDSCQAQPVISKLNSDSAAEAS